MAAITIRKVQTAGSFEDTRYEVTFLGEVIGHVASYTQTEVRCTGGRRYGTPVNVKRWEFEDADGKTRAYQLNYTRRQAIVRLLCEKHYPGREHIAERLVEKAGL